MGSAVTYTTSADAGANPLRLVAVYLAESQRLLLIHKRNVLSRTVRLTLETFADICDRMIAALVRLDAKGVSK